MDCICYERSVQHILKHRLIVIGIGGADPELLTDSRGDAVVFAEIALNDLTHTTMPVKVKRCNCRQIGCIERIFSSGYLRSRGSGTGFDELLSTQVTSNAEVKNMVDLLCRIVANAVNSVRPATLILSSPFNECQEFVRESAKRLAAHILSVLRQRFKAEWQAFDPDLNAICAASLPLARLFEGTG